jgi:Uma2 family endonuclease
MEQANMGAILEPEAGLPRDDLLRRWDAVLRDPVLRESPYRIELNRWGTIEMTPVKPFHSRVSQRLATFLEDALGGEAFTELAIALPAGLRVPDVAWCSPAFLTRHADEFEPASLALSEAPELCVEVMSESNSLGEIREKCDAYLAAGAIEAWIVMPDLRIRYFDKDGERAHSVFQVDMTRWSVA